MKLSAKSDEFLTGKEEGLAEAAKLVEQAMSSGQSFQWALCEMLVRADQLNVTRTFDFDETELEFVQRR